jgi:hypothetical protein|tara:strand:+ start:816 stop:962 length:147 start_codon:yes stop_codon:yes gene_type:complete
MVMDLKIVELSRTRKQLEYVVSESVSHEFDKDELEQEKITISQMVSDL